MPDIIAQSFNTFMRAAATDNGEHLVLKAQVGGHLVTLAIPQDEVRRLIQLLSSAAMGLSNQSPALPSDNQYLLIESIRCHPSNFVGSLVLKLRFLGGIRMSAIGKSRRMVELATEIKSLASFADAVETPQSKKLRH